MTSTKLQFRCPHCARVMQVSQKHLGQRGTCNACGGRIQLHGVPDTDSVQDALPLQERDDRLETLERAMLIQVWESLTGEPNQCPHRNDEIRAALREILEDSHGEGFPSDRQRSTLERLGLPSAFPDVRSGTKATLLIEDAHLQPTYTQRRVLQALEVPGVKLAAARTRAHARVLIEETLRSRA